MNSYNVITTALAAVRSHALLAVLDTAHKLLLACWCSVMLICLYGLWLCGTILFEHYSGLYQRRRQKSESENRQKPCEGDNAPGLPIPLPGENRLDRRKFSNGGDQSNSVGLRISSRCAFHCKAVKFVKQCVYFLGKVVMFRHTQNTANDQVERQPPPPTR